MKGPLRLPCFLLPPFVDKRPDISQHCGPGPGASRARRNEHVPAHCELPVLVSVLAAQNSRVPEKLQ